MINFVIVSTNTQDYHDVIKEPMDLGTIKKKFSKKRYTNGEDCMKDFRLMFSNCYEYNKVSFHMFLCYIFLEFLNI